MKRILTIFLTMIMCCLFTFGSTVFYAYSWGPTPTHPGYVEEWNGPFEHETLAFYFPDPDVPELAVRGVRKTEVIDDLGYYWCEDIKAPVVVIPDEVQGYPVTYVGWEVLSYEGLADERGIERIFVGKNVHILGHNAFAGQEVIIGKNELTTVYGDGNNKHEDYISTPFAAAKLHCYLDSDAYRIGVETGAWIFLIDESHLLPLQDSVKIGEDLTLHLPWNATAQTLTEYVSVDGDAKINVLGNTFGNGTQIELVNSTYGTIDNTYTVQLGPKPVTLKDTTVYAKTTFKLTPETVENGCTRTYTSDNPAVADVDKDGNVTAKQSGTAKITVTVTDEYGNEAPKSTCTVTVNYTWWQWLIRIFLFGWLWY